MAKTLSEIVIDAGIVTRAEVEEAARHAEDNRVPLIAAIVRHVGADELAVVTAIQRAVRGSMADPATVTLDVEALRQVPREVSRLRRVVPLSMTGFGSARRLVLAVADPTDEMTLAEIEHITQCQVETRLMTLSAVEELIEQGYRLLVTEVMPNRKTPGLPGHVPEVAAAPEATGPATVPFHRLSDEADIRLRHQALLNILLESGQISEDAYEAELTRLMRKREVES